MAQGRHKKALAKRARKHNKRFPMATVAFYGPTNTLATKVVCSIVESEDTATDQLIMRKWFSQNDIRNSEAILAEVLAFIDEHQAVSVAMADGILGCPHEEGIDYPEGEPCPRCPFWRNRDRFTGQIIH